MLEDRCRLTFYESGSVADRYRAMAAASGLTFSAFIRACAAAGANHVLREFTTPRSSSETSPATPGQFPLPDSARVPDVLVAAKLADYLVVLTDANPALDRSALRDALVAHAAVIAPDFDTLDAVLDELLVSYEPASD